MLTESERNKILVEWNRTAREYPKERCVHELFEAQVRANPGRIALVAGNESLTYAELNRRANTLASALRSEGAQPDSLVGLCVERTVDLVVGVLGILKAGGAYVPVDPTHPADRVAFVLEDSHARLLVTQRHLLPALPKTSARTLLFDELPSAPHLSENNDPSPTANNLAYVLYTSGSTGRPKGVPIPHRAVVNFLHSMQHTPGLTPDDVLLAVTTLSFDIAGLELFLPLVTGAKIVLAPWEVAADGEALLRTIERHQVTVLQATPATWRLMLAAGWKGTPTLKALCGGEALPGDLATELISKTAALWNMYGPTETTIWSTCSRVTDPSDIHIGRPIDNTEIYILDEQLQPLPVGQPGELFIGGDGLARGYWNRPELTAERFIVHPFRPGERLYRTGDLAQFSSDGAIACLGRLDHQVKIRGHRIELAEIETQLVNHPNIRQAVVVAREDTLAEKRLVAYFVARDNTPPPADELRTHLHATLPDYMMPAAFVPLTTLPLTPNGKIDRKALPAPETASAAAVRKPVPPRSPTEARLASMFKEILGVSDVSANDSFFDLGGHSLLAAWLMSRIERETGHRLPLARLFEAPTIASLGALLDKPEKSNAHWSSLVPIKPSSGKPVLFMIHGAGGNVLLYREVAEALAPEISVHGLQSRGLDRQAAPLRCIEEMAALYVKEIRSFQPAGPYHIAGYCMGGAIAYEMVRQLHSQGQQTGLIALLDTYNLALVDRRKSRLKNWSFLRQKIRFHLSTLLLLRPANLPGYLWEKIRMAVEASRSLVAAAWTSLWRRLRGEHIQDGRTAMIMSINHDAAWKYVPPELAANITVYRPRTNYSYMPDPKMGWNALVKGNLTIVELPANPHALLTVPCAGNLARDMISRILKQF